jgi:hypothetical protein
MRKARVLTLPALLALALGLALAAFGGATSAGAGGWAVTSLDPLPTLVPGEPLRVGFTVLQHGRTPVDATDRAEYGLVVRAPDGSVTEFEARPDGTPGHFVGEVTFPVAGTYTWSVRQGWFGPWELGKLVVEAPSGAGAASATTAAPASPPAPAPAPADPEPARSAAEDGRAPLALRLLLPVVAVAALALLALDVARAPGTTEAPVRAGA